MSKYRESRDEKIRLSEMKRMWPSGCSEVLEIGSRDCFITRALAEVYPHITALDLEKPVIDHPKITPVKGDVTALSFENDSFDLVLCTEVLEHIAALEKATSELSRVSSRYLLIGVPYRQDLRLHTLRCNHCGAENPTTGHINSFDKTRILSLFPDYSAMDENYIGRGRFDRTNSLSYALYKAVGFPDGTYSQDESCIYCHKKMSAPHLNLLQKMIAFLAKSIEWLQNRCFVWHRRPIWYYVLLEKR